MKMSICISLKISSQGYVDGQYLISQKIFYMFIDNKFTISSVANMFKVSESTIKRRLSFYGSSVTSSKYTNMTCQDLDDMVKEILEKFPKTVFQFNFRTILRDIKTGTHCIHVGSC